MKNAELTAILSPLLPLWGICDFPREMPLFQWAKRHPLPEDARRVVMAAFPYLLPEAYYAGRNISRYAVPADYHAVCGARLEQACQALRKAYPGEEFAHYCDSSPLPETALAQRAGLGVVGRHHLLITKDYGTWVFLGAIVTTAPLPTIAHCELRIANCEACPAPCEKACPAGVLGARAFDKTQCLSYRSQRKGELSGETAALMRRTHTAWGCDVCQEACLCNRHVKIDPLPEFLEHPVARITPQTEIEGRAYAWRGAAVLERNIRNLEM